MRYKGPLTLALLLSSLPTIGQQKINFTVIDGKKYGASDFLVDGEVENWRPDNSPFGFSGVRHVSWPGTRIDR